MSIVMESPHLATGLITFSKPGVMDFPIVLDAKSATPLFIQLSNSLKERIVAGSLQPGAQLPPTRELAEALGVARGTVVKAYDDLIAQGYLESLTGSSTFVSRRGLVERNAHKEIERLRNAPAPSVEKGLSSEARRLMSMSLSEGIAGYQEELNFGAPPSEMLPLTQWKEALLKQCRRHQPHHFDCAPETLGHYRLRVEMASYLARSKGLDCQPEQVIVFPGSQQALAYVSRILVDGGDTVVVENPGYGLARDHFAERGARVIAVDIDCDGIKVDELDALEERVKLAYVTPSFHDPTGTIMSLERRTALLSWASSIDAYLIEDGWDSDYVYVNPPLPSLQGLDKENRVIYLYSFWKVLYPLTTVGCAVVPPQLVPIFDRVKFMTERQFPILEHQALAEFLKDGGLVKHERKTKPVYEKRRKALTESLFSEFKTDIEVPRQSSGLHICVRFVPRLVAKGLKEAAQRAGFPMVNTVPYYAQSPKEGEYLIPFAGVSAEEIEARVVRFARELGAGT